VAVDRPRCARELVADAARRDRRDARRAAVVAQAALEHDGPGKVREDLEVDRVSAELAGVFQDVSPDVIEHGVREEFGRWSSARVRDFVPIFVARAVRGKLREHHGRAERDEPAWR
jgi:hypothetical protein